MTVSIQKAPSKADNYSLKRTMFFGPMVSTLERFHCTFKKVKDFKCNLLEYVYHFHLNCTNEKFIMKDFRDGRKEYVNHF